MAERKIAKRGKTKLEINKNQFQEVVSQLEKENTFSSIGDLWKAVENTDWAKNLTPRPLTAAVARLRAIELNIKYQAIDGKGKRGRVKVQVNKDEFQKQINLLESKNSFDKLDDLWKAIEETNWAKKQPKPITAVIARARAIELGVTTKTVNKTSGKRGRTKLEIDKDEFQNQVNLLESKNNFEKLDHLWKAIEETEWAKNLTPRPLTAIVAKIRAKELDIIHETTNSSGSGKRGREKLEVDKDEFQNQVNLLESKNNFGKLDDLWKAIQETDWAKNLTPRPLTAVVARVRAIELGIITETNNSGAGKRGREKLEVDKDEFQKIVQDLEEKYHFDRIDDLWKAVENTNWAKDLSPRPLTAIVAKMRAEELGIETRIKPRKRKANENHSEVDEKEERIAKSHAMNDVLHLENTGIPRISNMTMVLIPAGNCPYKLENTEEESVVTWCKKVVNYFANKQQQITPTALTYFSRQFFDINTSDFNVVKSNIQMNKHMFYETIIA